MTRIKSKPLGTIQYVNNYSVETLNECIQEIIPGRTTQRDITYIIYF